VANTITVRTSRPTKKLMNAARYGSPTSDERAALTRPCAGMAIPERIMTRNIPIQKSGVRCD